VNTRQVEAISKLLRDSREVEPPHVTASTRARTIEALEGALQTRAQRRRRARRVWAALAAAAVIAAGVGGAWKLGAHHETASQSPTPSAPPVVETVETTVETSPQPPERAELPQGLAMADGSILQPGSRIVAPPHRRAVLSFSSGTHVTVGGGGDITVVEAGDVQRFLLSNGSIDAHVAKLHAGQRWLVTTPDAEVEVRGTAFEVSIVPPDPSCGGGTRTRVSVREGVVSVRTGDGEVRVHPGEVWPAGCRRVAALATAATQEAPVTAVSPTPATPPPAATHAAPAVTSHSTLAEQNDAFARIVSLRQRGDMAGSAAEVDRFLARFPASPLAESARVEQMRALRVSDPPRAASVAREYLAQYPRGFARAEAQAIASQGK